MVRSRSTLAVCLVCLTVLLAGCAGMGTDDPSAEADEPEPEETGDLEEADDADQDESDDPDEATVGSDADGDAADESTDVADNPSPESDDADESEGDVFELDDGSDGDDGEEADEEDATDTDDGDTIELVDADETDSSADEQGDENGEQESDDGEETNGDDADAEDHTLTVAAEDVVTGEPAGDAYYLLQQDGETIGEEQHGETAAFEGLEDGEYALSVYDATANWSYDATITVDEDVEYTAEVDRMHVYWATIEATVVDESGDPVEGETVMINGQAIPTDEDGVALYDREFHYADEIEATAEYGDRSETFVFDHENADTETATFEADSESGETDDEQAALTIAP